MSDSNMNRSFSSSPDNEAALSAKSSENASSTLRKLNDQQSAAVAVAKNAVVAAGAGSGKTTVLARRYLELVRDRGADVSSILTLTFTRKAAAEMHERIYSLLLSDREHPRVARAIEMFDDAQISTLDSFCLQIARERPGLFGLSRDFGIDDRRIDEEAREQAIRFIEANADDQSLREFVQTNGFESILDGFFTHIASRYVTIAGRHDFSEMFERQVSELRSQIFETCIKIKSIVRECAVVEPVAGSIAKVQANFSTLNDLEEMIGREDYDSVVELLGGIKPRRSGNVKAPELVIVKDLIERYLAIREDALSLAETMAVRELIRDIMGLCSKFQDTVLEGRRDSGACSYDDVVRMAVAVLTADLSVREYYKERFDFIMIDEFQDNNSLQRDLLYLLSEVPGKGESGAVPIASDLEPTKLFFVGDQKQSIYRFRGADVGVFKSLAAEITESGGTYINLPVNYRSAPELITFFNRLFSEVMSNADHSYEASFEELLPRDPIPGETSEVAILYKPHIKDPEPGMASSYDAEACAIADLIGSLMQTAVIPDEAGGTRPLEYRDIAILMRSTSNQNKFERALRNGGIPYSVDSARSLFIESIFNDMYAILQTVVYPSDSFAYATLLRSPLVGVSDVAVTRLLLDFHGVFTHADTVLSSLGSTDSERYEAGRRLYREVCKTAQSASHAEVVSKIWYDSGYRFHVLARSEYHGYLDHFDYLQTLASDADSRGETLAELLDYLREHLGQYKRLPDLEVLRRDESGVRIMTIHKSKGLEFPVVIFANTGNKGANDDTSAPYYLSEEHGFAVNVRRSGRKNYFYLQAKAENDAKELAEIKRLAYVACTRAKYRLYISGCHNAQNQNAESVHLNMVLRALGWDGAEEVIESSALKPYIRPIPDIPEKTLYIPSQGRNNRHLSEARHAYAASAEKSYPEPQQREWAVTEIGPWMRRHRPESFPAISDDNLPVARDPELEALLRPGDEALFGTLCHAVLAEYVTSYASSRVAVVDGSNAGANESAIPKIIQNALIGFDKNVRDQIFEKAKSLCDGIFRSKLARLLDGVRVETEVPFTLQVADDVRVRGQIDCLFATKDNITILDYKTDAVLDARDHRHQMQLYRDAVATWYDFPVRMYLVYIRHDVLVEFSRSDSADGELDYPWT